MFPLRLLIAEQCNNMTARGLAEALTHFPNIAYLDLSFNSSARDHSILSKLNDMPSLNILRLRHCLLKDQDIEVLGAAIGLRVRSLDLRNNHLTDASIRTLLHHCFRARGSRSRASSGVEVEDSADWPAGFARPDVNILDEFRDQTLNERFVKRLTSGVINRLPSQDLRQSGVTHLYIAHNQLSVEGVSSLIKQAQLYVLDVGSFHTWKLLEPRATSSSSPSKPVSYLVSLPGAERLPPVLEDFGKDLTFLRLNHSVVTQEAASKDEPTTPNVTELEVSTARSELDSIPTTAELPIEDPAPRYELPGDAMQIVLTLAMGAKPSADDIEQGPDVRREGAFAPEAVANADEEEAEPVLTATGLGTTAQAMNGIGPSAIQEPVVPDLQSLFKNLTGTDDYLTPFEEQLQSLRSQRAHKPHGLLPGMLPRLRTLVLTGVPCFDRSGVIDFLISFIEACALEDETTKLQAQFANDTLRIPSSSNAAHRTFPLRRIILEMSPPGSTPQSLLSASKTKSSTEDPDSEAFWSAQENDFSFFDDDEECGLPARERQQFPLSALSEKMVMPTDEHGSIPTLQNPQDRHPATDVVQELARFRKDRKAAYENAVKSGKSYVEGHWSGEIQIIRGHAKPSDHIDYYGNVYERGGVYR